MEQNNMTQDEIMAYLEDIKWGDRVISPFKPQGRVWNHPDRFTYLCKETQREFSVLTNTYLMYDRRHLEKWKLLVDLLAARTDELTIETELQVSSITKKAMYRKIYQAMRYTPPTMSKDLHFFLIREFKRTKPTAEQIFKRLLQTKTRRKRRVVKKERVKVVTEVGMKREFAY